MTQNEMILRHLKAYGKIDPMTALKLCGCFRLSQRIKELENDGYNIFHDINIGKKKFAIYTLVK